MLAKSIYIVYSKIVRLGEKPFLDKSKVRPAFHSMFCNPHCFSDLHTLFYDEDRPIPLPSKPFLKGLGQICFNARSINLRTHAAGYDLSRIITGRRKYWDSNDKLRPINDFYFDGDDFGFQRGDVFGIDPLQEDERMNFLYFELFKPLFIKAMIGTKIMAQGKIFIHIYPSGFLYFFVAVSLDMNHIENQDDLRVALHETRPSNNGSWVWKSKLGVVKLNEIFSKVQELACNSILQPPFSIQESSWRSFAKIIEPDNSINFPKLLIRGDYDTLSINHLPGEGEYKFNELISSNQGFLLMMPQHKKRGDSLALFWKFSKILEYICFLDFIYRDYVGYLKKETMQLKEYRLSLLSKLQNDDFLRMTAYDRNLARFVQTMAGHIHTTTGFYRRVFSSYWNGIEFGKHKETFKRVLDEWEEEVEKWDNNFVTIWKKMIAPLRALFAPSK